MGHNTRDGEMKIMKRCSLPLTGARVVNRIITDLAVIDVADAGLVVRELAPGISRDALQARTEPALSFAFLRLSAFD